MYYIYVVKIEKKKKRPSSQRFMDCRILAHFLAILVPSTRIPKDLALSCGRRRRLINAIQHGRIDELI